MDDARRQALIAECLAPLHGHVSEPVLAQVGEYFAAIVAWAIAQDEELTHIRTETRKRRPQ